MVEPEAGGCRCPCETTGTVCAWQLPDAGEQVRIVSADAEETVLEILCAHGASYDINLNQH